MSETHPSSTLLSNIGDDGCCGAAAVAAKGKQFGPRTSRQQQLPAVTLKTLSSHALLYEVVHGLVHKVDAGAVHCAVCTALHCAMQWALQWQSSWGLLPPFPHAVDIAAIAV